MCWVVLVPKSTLFIFQASSIQGGAPPPKPFEPFYVSVHPVGDEWEEAQVAEVKKDQEEWRKRVVVDDVQFHTHR
jgi:hypothetical protein